MGVFDKLFGGGKVVDVMIGICVHDPDILLQPPSNVKSIAMQSLQDGIKNASLSPNAKTAYLIARGTNDFAASEKQAAKDLPGQMTEFMKQNGFDPDKYTLEYFTEELQSEIKVLWAAAVKK